MTWGHLAAAGSAATTAAKVSLMLDDAVWGSSLRVR